MLEKVIKEDENSPPFCSLLFAMQCLHSKNALKSRVGRPKINLLSLIQSDLKERGFKLETSDDIYQIKQFFDEGGKF